MAKTSGCRWISFPITSGDGTLYVGLMIRTIFQGNPNPETRPRITQVHQDGQFPKQRHQSVTKTTMHEGHRLDRRPESTGLRVYGYLESGANQPSPPSTTSGISTLGTPILQGKFSGMSPAHSTRGEEKEQSRTTHEGPRQAKKSHLCPSLIRLQV